MKCVALKKRGLLDLQERVFSIDENMELAMLDVE
jgi:hypothetical protein